MYIIDMAASEEFNPMTNNNRGYWSLYDVSNKQVVIDPMTNKPRCTQHNAMNCVSSDRRIWRCLTCARSCVNIDQKIIFSE